MVMAVGERIRWGRKKKTHESYALVCGCWKLKDEKYIVRWITQ
jgi:hypothetical protein